MKRCRITILILALMLTIVGCGNDSTANVNLSDKAPISSVQKNQTEPQVSTAKDNSKLNESGKKADNQKEQNQNNAEEISTKEKTQINHADTAAPAAANQKKVSLLVTRDFGRRIIFDKEVPIDNKSCVLDVLKANLDVETKYDGGFIGSINGLKTQGSGMSGKRGDWFYYVNGVCSHVGSTDYKLRTGETVWWDYHPWSSGPAITSVIGCYPEPFLHGYNGKIGCTNILYTEGNVNNANSLHDALKAKGANMVKVLSLSEELVKNRQGPTIVLGEWDRLKEFSYLDGLNKAYRKNGTSVHFLDNSLELLNFSGQVDRKIDGSVAVIAATGEGLGDTNPLWLVAGTDNSAVTQATDILVKNPGKIFRLYNAAVSSGELIALPLQ